MKVIRSGELDAGRIVKYASGVSNRLLLESDGMGFTMTKTVVKPGIENFQHYRNHMESCYCVSGDATLTNTRTGEEFRIGADDTYILDKHDPHSFKAHVETVLICVFNPPLVGTETHDAEGSYPPAKGFRSPVYDVKRVPISKVKANTYNPNAVAPPEMELLETSIWEDGYTQPVVTYYDPDEKMYIVVDGFHRWRVCNESARIKEREQGMLPIVVIDKAIGDRMASTIRHNRARGTHNVELMSSIVAELVDIGKGDAWICKHIGMSKDELLRLKQITGVAALFENKDFSDSWEAEEVLSDEFDESKVS